MRTFLAPAKLNLSLLVSSPRSDGMHPLQSLVQMVDLCDRLTFAESHSDAAEDSLSITGLELETNDNLVMRAIRSLREESPVPYLDVHLDKRIPIRAGLGGGSSDAAAALIAANSSSRPPRDDLSVIALRLGADVPLFLTGGTQIMSGVGEVLESIESLADLAFAIVIPDFGLETAETYREWDRLGGPVGDEVRASLLPPVLRNGIPIRNDLTPAAVSLKPRLGDLLSDLNAAWDVPALLTGSGSACFGMFRDAGEAADAVVAVSDFIKEGWGVAARDVGAALAE